MKPEECRCPIHDPERWGGEVWMVDTEGWPHVYQEEWCENENCVELRCELEDDA